jgi:hypothetical protein
VVGLIYRIAEVLLMSDEPDLSKIFGVPPVARNPFGGLTLGDLRPPPNNSLAPSPPAMPPALLAQVFPVLPAKSATNALVRPQVKRKVYFAFDFEDLFRVNNVRQAWKITNPA